jgi:hypothetical protein
MTDTEIDVGPIDYLAVEFPKAKFDGDALNELVKLVDAGIVRVLDLRVAMVGEDGSFTAMELADVDGDGELDLSIFTGVRSGLLDDDDLAQGAALVEAGNAVAVVLYENTWAGPLVSALRRKGADVIASGRIPASEVIAALEALESEG